MVPATKTFQDRALPGPGETQRRKCGRRRFPTAARRPRCSDILRPCRSEGKGSADPCRWMCAPRRIILTTSRMRRLDESAFSLRPHGRHGQVGENAGWHRAPAWRQMPGRVLPDGYQKETQPRAQERGRRPPHGGAALRRTSKPVLGTESRHRSLQPTSREVVAGTAAAGREFLIRNRQSPDTGPGLWTENRGSVPGGR